MKVKKYEAASVQEALSQVRSELGLDAVILHTRKLQKGGFLGLFGKECVEVLATNDVKIHESEAVPEMNRKFQVIQGELQEMKHFIQQVLRHTAPKEGPKFPPAYDAVYERLLDNEVEAKVAEELLREALQHSDGNGGSPEQVVRDCAARLLGRPEPVQLEPDQCKVVILIGPTGVGKTTTLAKLAVQKMLNEEKRVAFITADTYRLAAIDHLRKYAEIMQAPVEVVFSPKEMREAISRHTDRDLILMDTAGRSQNNTSQLMELREFVEASYPSEVHLVLAANTRFRDLQDVLQKFGVVRYDRLIFTKLDECTTFGNLLNVKARVKCPLSYVTNGQEVPDDMEIADPEKLAKLVLRGAVHA